jgi:hypothetical protein
MKLSTGQWLVAFALVFIAIVYFRRAIGRIIAVGLGLLGLAIIAPLALFLVMLLYEIGRWPLAIIGGAAILAFLWKIGSNSHSPGSGYSDDDYYADQEAARLRDEQLREDRRLQDQFHR